MGGRLRSESPADFVGMRISMIVRATDNPSPVLLLRGSRNFEDLPTYRRSVDEVVGRRNARNRNFVLRA
jgi:hypothetical protein